MEINSLPKAIPAFMSLDYQHEALAYLETATLGLLVCAKIHLLFLMTQLNQWLNRWCKWAGQFLRTMFTMPWRIVVTAGYLCGLERDQLFQKVSQGIYNLSYSFSIKIHLLYCVLKISAPNMSLFLHCQHDALTPLPRKQSPEFDRWMEAEASLVLCGMYVNRMFLLNGAPVKELTFPLPHNATCEEWASAAMTDPLTHHQPIVSCSLHTGSRG